MPKFPVPEVGDHPGGIINNQIAKEMEREANKARSNNRQLAGMMKDIYPFDYGLIESVPDDLQELRKDGYQFILLKMHASGETIKRLLDYEINPNQDQYVTQKRPTGGNMIIRRIPKEAPVYKYYIQHISSGRVYLGEQWDADELWSDALENHINNLKYSRK